MTGYAPDVLADVSMVANDFQITPGTCGKGWKELVPNARAAAQDPDALPEADGPADRRRAARSPGIDD